MNVTTERRWPTSFTARLTAPPPRARDMWRVLLTGGFARRDLSDAGRIPVARREALPCVESAATGVTWVGHATYVLQIGGLTVLTDPVWSSKIPGTPARLTPVGLPFDALPRVDAVVISHNHYDHLDARTIRRLPRQTPVLVPGGLGRWFWRRGFTRVTELDWWESTELDGVEFGFVPAHHWSRRGLADTCRSLWGGWVISAPAPTAAPSGMPAAAAGAPVATVYFAGDTGYGHWFGEIAQRCPAIDLALLPVGAYEPNWFMKPVHLNPQEAVRACLDLGATRMATMHWGTFALSREPLLAPREESIAAWQRAGRPREDLWTLAIGESRTLPPRQTPSAFVSAQREAPDELSLQREVDDQGGQRGEQ